MVQYFSKLLQKVNMNLQHPMKLHILLIIRLRSKMKDKIVFQQEDPPHFLKA